MTNIVPVQNRSFPSLRHFIERSLVNTFTFPQSCRVHISPIEDWRLAFVKPKWRLRKTARKLQTANAVLSLKLLLMYEALSLPYLDYCSEVWGCMGKSQCDRQQKMQNRAGRIVTFSDYNTRSADILQDLGWDSLAQRRSKQLAISVFKSLHNLYPEGLKNMFKPTSGVHSHYRAHQTMFLCPVPVLKLLRGHLATGGLSCGMALVRNSKMRQISTLSSPL